MSENKLNLKLHSWLVTAFFLATLLLAGFLPGAAQALEVRPFPADGPGEISLGSEQPALGHRATGMQGGLEHQPEGLAAGLRTVLDQAPGLDWEQTCGGDYNDRAECLQQTSDGGYILAGGTYAPSNGGSDFYLAKLDGQGNVLWQKNYGGAGDEWAYSVRQTADGGYILVGDTNSTGAVGYDVYVVKTGSTGVMEWSKTFGGAANDYGSGVALCAGGGYVVVGETYSYSTSDAIYLVRLDAAGNVKWGWYYGSSGTDWGYDVLQSADGGFVIAGGTNSFGAGGEDVFLFKVDATGGTILWQKTFGGTGRDRAMAVCRTADGGYIVAGETSSYGAGGSDLYLVKTGATGNKVWENYYGGSADDWGMSVCQTADGGYLAGGSTLSFGAGGSDLYLVKTDAAGGLLWQQTLGGAGNDRGACAIETADSGYAIAGATVSPNGWTDAYLAKFLPAAASEDMNYDGSINILDLLWIQARLGPVTEANRRADVNADGTVNMLDLLQTAGRLGPADTPGQPLISGIDPTSGPAGTAVAITGTNFGASQGNSAVTFNGVAAGVTSWSASLITATVPTGASTGSVVVTVNGRPSNGVLFNVTTVGETVIFTQTATIGPSGGTINLGDGASLTVAPGTLSAGTALTFNKFGNERNFSGPYWLAYEVLGTTGFLPGTLTVPVPPELAPDQDRIGVLRYNPETMEGDSPQFAYNAQAGTITLTMTAATQLAQAVAEGRAAGPGLTGEKPFPGYRAIIELGKAATQVYAEKTIKMPYYEQVGETCWAADMVMLSKAFTPYSNREKELEIYDYMKCMGLGLEDGIGTYDFKHNLNQCFHTATGAGVSAYSWLCAENLKDFMILELKKGYPLILRYPGHALLVTGYKHYQHGIRTMTDFQVHDSKGINPPSANDGGMYTWRNYQDWLAPRLVSGVVVINSLLWSHDTEPHPDRALQTIGLSSQDNVGKLGFQYLNDWGAVVNTRFSFAENEPKGYTWYTGTNKVEAIPYRAEKLYLDLPLWNADLDNSVPVRVEVEVLQGGNTSPAYSYSQNITLGTDRNPGKFTKDIPICEFKKSTGSLSYTLKVKLYNGAVYQDGFSVDFTMEEGPTLCSLDPAIGEAGTELTIRGSGFGADQGNSKVTFNDTPVKEIISWSPSKIVVTVPGAATTGDVVVTVADKPSKGINFEVQPIDLTYPVRITYVSGQNDDSMPRLQNHKGQIKISSGTTGLWLTVKCLIDEVHGSADCSWQFKNLTQHDVEEGNFTRRSYDQVEMVELTGTGFLAKLDSELKVFLKNASEPYQTITNNAQISGTVSAGKASGTIHWTYHEVGGSTDVTKFYNYSFVPDI